MGLYNMIFGVNENADVALAMIGRKRSDFPRFRDVFLTADTIGVYTRLGGGNRECWEGINDVTCECPGCFITYRASLLPGYLRDQDDEFDSTYCTIFFGIPSKDVVAFEALKKQTKTPDEKWQQYLTDLKAEKVQPNSDLVAMLKEMLDYLAGGN